MKVIVVAILATLLCIAVSADDNADTLQLFYTSTGGDNWTNNANWLSGNPCPDGNWFGVTCAGSDVTKIELPNNNLVNSLPDPCLGNLYMLEVLDLSFNKLTGYVPIDFGQFTTLVTLRLNNNQMIGDFQLLAANPSFKEINLGHNKFSGEIGNFLSNAAKANIESLNLESNDLEGNLPDWFLDLTAAVLIRLGDNNLSGLLPAQDSQTILPLLETLDLHLNNFVGAIPPWAGNLAQSNLVELNLQSNQLTGSIPNFYGPNKLQFLFLSDNQLTGVIPAVFDLPVLVRFDVSNNQLEGSLPPIFFAIGNIVSLHFAHNNFSDAIPAEYSQLDSSQSLDSLDLSHNNLNGTVPSFWSTAPSFSLDLRANNFSCPLPAWCSSSNGGNGMCEPCSGADNQTTSSHVDNPSGGSSSGNDNGDTPWWEIMLIAMGISFVICLLCSTVGVVACFTYQKQRRRTAYTRVN